VIVQQDTSDNPPLREHPWSDAASGPNSRYCDFVSHPEQIPLALEDFKPFAHYEAIQTFYALLTWLNGPHSPFETNDCGLLPPRTDHSTPGIVRVLFDADPTVFHGRLTVLYRNLIFNSSQRHINWLNQNVQNALRDRVPHFAAVIFVGQWPHWFVATDRPGQVLSLRFWAWGGDQAGAMQSLENIFVNLQALFEGLAAAMRLQDI